MPLASSTILTTFIMTGSIGLLSILGYQVLILIDSGMGFSNDFLDGPIVVRFHKLHYLLCDQGKSIHAPIENYRPDPDGNGSSHEQLNRILARHHAAHPQDGDFYSPVAFIDRLARNRLYRSARPSANFV